MTDRTPTTETGRRTVAAYGSDEYMLSSILAIEAEARAELDVETLKTALDRELAAFLEQPESFDNMRLVAEFVAREYAALTRSKP